MHTLKMPNLRTFFAFYAPFYAPQCHHGNYIVAPLFHTFLGHICGERTESMNFPKSIRSRLIRSFISFLSATPELIQIKRARHLKGHALGLGKYFEQKKIYIFFKLPSNTLQKIEKTFF